MMVNAFVFLSCVFTAAKGQAPPSMVSMHWKGVVSMHWKGVVSMHWKGVVSLVPRPLPAAIFNGARKVVWHIYLPNQIARK